MILLIIISNNILLSLPIALTNHFIPDGSLFWYTKSHLSIVGNCLSYIALLKSTLATILFFKKCTIYHYTLLRLIFSSFLLPFLPYNYWAVGFKMAISWSRTFFESYPQFRTKKAWWPIARFAGRSKYNTEVSQYINL